MEKSENLSLFDTQDDFNSNHTSQLADVNSLDVVKLEYLEAQRMDWRELFSGFDTLHAITYSSGIGFIYKLLDLFETAEIIFGCEDVISFSLQEVMAYQCKLIDRLKENAGAAQTDLADRVESGGLRLFVAHTKLSHEKIYLLSAKDGKNE